MKYVFACVASSVLGVVFTLWLIDGRQSEMASAQGRAAQPGPAFPGQREPDPKRGFVKPLLVRSDVTAEEAVNVAVYERTNRSVVNITTKSGQNFLFLEGVSEGSGSGCVLDKRGHILTNFHVIEEARTANVTLYNGKTYEASLVGADPYYDIAVLKIKSPKEFLHPIELGDSKQLRVGMRVFAIGNPFGLERTMTTGIISSLNRSLKIRGDRTIRSIIQIDAAVNPGNSGGPLLDTHGRVIGINTAIATRTGQSAGVGFAIPASLIARVTPQLVKHGRVKRPEIGIRRVYETEDGLLIASLSPNGPAAKAGLRGPGVTRTRRGIFVIERVDRSAADTITAIDGKPVKTADDFRDQIESRNPGDRVTLTILRGGKPDSVRVTLGGR